MNHRNLILMLVAILFLFTGCVMTRAEDVMRIPEFNRSAFDKWHDKLKNQNIEIEITDLGQDYAFAITGADTLSIQVYNKATLKNFTIPLNGNYIEKVRQHDVNHDGTKEIFISYRHLVKGSVLKVIDVLSPQSPIYNAQVKNFEITNLKGRDNLYVMVHKNNQELSDSEILEIDLESFKVLDRVNVGPAYYAHMVAGQFNSKEKGLFYSVGLSAGARYDVITINETGRLRTLFYGFVPDESIPTTEYYASIMDTNGNGIMEFPTLRPYPHTNTKSDSTDVVYLTDYHEQGANGLEFVNTIYQMYNGYIIMKPEWIENWALQSVSSENVIIAYHFLDVKTKARLFTINFVNISDLNTLVKSCKDVTIISENEENATLICWGTNLNKQDKEAILKCVFVDFIASAQEAL